MNVVFVFGDKAIISGRRSIHSPGRHAIPALQRFSRPLGCPIRMAACAWIGNLVLIGHFRRDEVKGVAANIDVGDGLRDFRHVARNAIVARTSGGMMGMGLDVSGMRSVG